MLTKIREFVDSRGEELFIFVVILLVAGISFGAGRLTSPNNLEVGALEVLSTPISPDELSKAMEGKVSGTTVAEAQVPTSIVGNKNSKVFHLDTCSGARAMAEQNKVFFASVEAAVDAGYRPAANCPGL